MNKKNRKFNAVIQSYENSGTILLTPLIDVVFLVLIFFVISATFSINPVIKIKPPKAVTGEPVLKKEIVVTISRDERIYIQNDEVPLNSFVTSMEKALSETESRRVMVLGDELVPYKILIRIIDKLRILGIEDILLMTEKGPPARQ